jgi:hypothetical protein
MWDIIARAVSTKDEEIFVSGGGPDDGAPQHMTSYRSELGGGVCEGMAVFGKMTRSEKINIIAVRFMRDNETAVKRCNQK